MNSNLFYIKLSSELVTLGRRFPQLNEDNHKDYERSQGHDEVATTKHKIQGTGHRVQELGREGILDLGPSHFGLRISNCGLPHFELKTVDFGF